MRPFRPIGTVPIIALSAALSFAACTQAPPVVRVISAPQGGIAPDAEVDKDGVLHLVYVSGEDLYYVKSLDNGGRFSEPMRVNTEPGTVFAGAYRGPDLAVGQDGQMHVIWYTNAYQRKLPPDQWGVHYAHLDASRAAFTPGRNMNHLPSDNYALAADGRGRVALFWMAEKAFVQYSDDGGETFSEAAVLDLADPCECCGSRAYFSPAGDLYFAYRDKRDNMRDMYLLVRRAGQETFVRQALSRTPWRIEACPMTGTYLAGDREGLAAAWETQGRIYFGLPDAGGQISEEIQAAEKGKYPVVLRASDGTTVVAWKEDETLVWQGYDAGGKPAGERGSMPADAPHRPAGAVTSDGQFLLFP
jgi:hypothetical protein